MLVRCLYLKHLQFFCYLGHQRMMTFKEFLLSRDHEVHNHERAMLLYNDYKLEFRRGALAEFFQQHSEEEWFLERFVLFKLTQKQQFLVIIHF